MAPLTTFLLPLLATSTLALPLLVPPKLLKPSADGTYDVQDFLATLRHHRGVPDPDNHELQFYGPGPALDDGPGPVEKELDPYLREKKAAKFRALQAQHEAHATKEANAAKEAREVERFEREERGRKMESGTFSFGNVVRAPAPPEGMKCGEWCAGRFGERVLCPHYCAMLDEVALRPSIQKAPAIQRSPTIREAAASEADQRVEEKREAAVEEKRNEAAVASGPGACYKPGGNCPWLHKPPPVMSKRDVEAEVEEWIKEKRGKEKRDEAAVASGPGSCYKPGGHCPWLHKPPPTKEKREVEAETDVVAVKGLGVVAELVEAGNLDS